MEVQDLEDSFLLKPEEGLKEHIIHCCKQEHNIEDEFNDGDYDECFEILAGQSKKDYDEQNKVIIDKLSKLFSLSKGSSLLGGVKEKKKTKRELELEKKLEEATKQIEEERKAKEQALQEAEQAKKEAKEAKTKKRKGIEQYDVVNFKKFDKTGEQQKYDPLNYQFDENKTAFDRNLEKNKNYFRNYQKDFIQNWSMSAQEVVILYYGVGSGKTLIAVNCAEQYNVMNPNSYVYFLSPASLVLNTIAEMYKAGIDPKRKNKDDEYIYNFVSYQQLLYSNFTFKNNALLIVDEVHNLRNFYSKEIKEKVSARTWKDSGNFSLVGTKLSQKLLENENKFIRSIFMTGTLFVNSLYDLEPIISLGYKKTPMTFMDIKDLDFINENKKAFEQYYKGLISFYRIPDDSKDFPMRKYEFVAVPSKKEYKGSMSEYNVVRRINRLKKSKDADEYEDEIMDLQNALKKYKDGDLSAFDDLEIGLPEKDAYFIKSRNETATDKGEYILKFLTSDKHKNEKTLIYSQFRGYSLEPLLKELSKKKIKYGFINGSMKQEDKIRVVNQYNNNEIRVLFFTLSIKEGISFAETNNIIVVEPYWNYAIMEQILARGIRLTSHKEKNKATVNLYMLVGVAKDDEETKKWIDEANNIMNSNIKKLIYPEDKKEDKKEEPKVEPKEEKPKEDIPDEVKRVLKKRKERAKKIQEELADERAEESIKEKPKEGKTKSDLFMENLQRAIDSSKSKPKKTEQDKFNESVETFDNLLKRVNFITDGIKSTRKENKTDEELKFSKLYDEISAIKYNLVNEKYESEEQKKQLLKKYISLSLELLKINDIKGDEENPIKIKNKLLNDDIRLIEFLSYLRQFINTYLDESFDYNDDNIIKYDLRFVNNYKDKVKKLYPNDENNNSSILNDVYKLLNKKKTKGKGLYGGFKRKRRSWANSNTVEDEKKQKEKEKTMSFRFQSSDRDIIMYNLMFDKQEKINVFEKKLLNDIPNFEKVNNPENSEFIKDYNKKVLELEKENGDKELSLKVKSDLKKKMYKEFYEESLKKVNKYVEGKRFTDDSRFKANRNPDAEIIIKENDVKFPDKEKEIRTILKDGGGLKEILVKFGIDKTQLTTFQANFTPSYLVDFIIKESGIENNKNKNIKILEPTAGIGNMIGGLLKLPNKENFMITANEIHSIFYQTGKIMYEDFNEVEFTNMDFMNFKSKYPFDYVIGNPPFNLRTTISSYDESKEKIVKVDKNLYDVDFVARAYNMLATGGRLCMIISNRFERETKISQFIVFKKYLEFFPKDKYKVINIGKFLKDKDKDLKTMTKEQEANFPMVCIIMDKFNIEGNKGLEIDLTNINFLKDDTKEFKALKKQVLIDNPETKKERKRKVEYNILQDEPNKDEDLIKKEEEENKKAKITVKGKKSTKKETNLSTGDKKLSKVDELKKKINKDAKDYLDLSTESLTWKSKNEKRIENEIAEEIKKSKLKTKSAIKKEGIKLLKEKIKPLEEIKNKAEQIKVRIMRDEGFEKDIDFNKYIFDQQTLINELKNLSGGKIIPLIKDEEGKYNVLYAENNEDIKKINKYLKQIDFEYRNPELAQKKKDDLLLKKQQLLEKKKEIKKQQKLKEKEKKKLLKQKEKEKIKLMKQKEKEKKKPKKQIEKIPKIFKNPKLKKGELLKFYENIKDKENEELDQIIPSTEGELKQFYEKFQDYNEPLTGEGLKRYIKGKLTFAEDDFGKEDIEKVMKMYKEDIKKSTKKATKGKGLNEIKQLKEQLSKLDILLFKPNFILHFEDDFNKDLQLMKDINKVNKKYKDMYEKLKKKKQQLVIKINELEMK